MPLKGYDWEKFSEGAEGVPKDPNEWEQKYLQLISESQSKNPEKIQEYHGDTLLNPESYPDK